MGTYGTDTTCRLFREKTDRGGHDNNVSNEFKSPILKQWEKDFAGTRLAMELISSLTECTPCRQ